MKTLLCFFNCLTGVLYTSAQSMAHTHSPLFTINAAYNAQTSHPFSFLSNTAALANCKQFSAGAYAENKFSVRELNHHAAALQFPVAMGALGLMAQKAGAADFNQSQLALAYGKNLGRVNVGLRFNYTMIRMAGYGGAGAITFELGSTWQITEKFYSGIQVTNPYGGKLGNEKMPSVYCAGAGYVCSDELFISVDIIKEENKMVNVRAGLQYNIDDKLLAAVGVNSAISSPSVLISRQWKDLRVFMTASVHPQLGITSGIGIIYYGRKKE